MDLKYTSSEETPGNIRSLTLTGFAEAGSRWIERGLRREFNAHWQAKILEDMQLIVDTANRSEPFAFHSFRDAKYEGLSFQDKIAAEEKDQMHEVGTHPDCVLPYMSMLNLLHPPYNIAFEYRPARNGEYPVFLVHIDNTGPDGQSAGGQYREERHVGEGDFTFSTRQPDLYIKESVVDTACEENDLAEKVVQIRQNPLEGSRVYYRIAAYWDVMKAIWQHGQTARAMEAFERVRQQTHSDLMECIECTFHDASYLTGSGFLKAFSELIATAFPHPMNPTPYYLMQDRGGYSLRDLAPVFKV